MNISITVPPFLKSIFYFSFFLSMSSSPLFFCHGSNPFEPRTVHIRGVSYLTAHAGFHSQIRVTLSVRCSQEGRCVNYLTSIIQVRSHSIQNANMSGVLQSMYHRCIILGIIQLIVHIQHINVSGFEKRAHFAQNAKIWQFSTYHNLKTPRALGFRLGL